MHDHVAIACEQRLAQGAGKNACATERRKGLPRCVAVGGDRHQFDLTAACFAQRRSDHLGLREGEVASTGSDTQRGRHNASAPEAAPTLS